MSPDWPEKYNHSDSSQTEKERRELDLLHQYSEFDYKPVNVDEGWKVLQSRLQVESAKSDFSVYWKVAAVILLVAGAVFIATQLDPFVSEDQLVTVNTEDVARAYQLPDGSIVTMSENSTLTYNEESFAEDRNITFEGEAFFEVVKNNSTFSIKTPAAQVTVLGTSFNLEANEAVNLFVKSGLVALATSKETKKVQPGQLASTGTSGQITVTQNTDPNLLSWKTGVFTFEDTKLTEAFKYLEKYYDVAFSSNEELSDCSITASFNKKPLKEVVEVISTILSAKSQIDNKEVSFTGTGCK